MLESKKDAKYVSHIAKFKSISGGYSIARNLDSVTVDEMTMAICNSDICKGIEESDAREMARHIMNYFGYQDQIIDNVLQTDDRNIFYMLEDSGLLTTGNEITTLPDQREWRISYWVLKKDNIKKRAREKQKENNQEHNKSENIYKSLPEDAWIR